MRIQSIEITNYKAFLGTHKIEVGGRNVFIYCENGWDRVIYTPTTAVDVPRFIRIGSDGTRRFQFGLVSGDIDGEVEQCGYARRFEFYWSGQDESDPVSGLRSGLGGR